MMNFDEPLNRRQSESIKWRLFDEDVLPMWVADMDFRSPEPVMEALHQRIEHGVFGYPGMLDGLVETIVARMQNQYGWSIQPEDVMLVPGVVTGFNYTAHALCNPGEGMLMQTPVYHPFLDAPKNAGLLRQETLLVRDEAGQYQVDFEAFEAAITPQTRLFLLCNPHNPVGRVFRREELERMADICLRHGLLICSDEIHCDLVFAPNRHIPIASLAPEIAQNTVTLMAPSKTYNIAGLECSFAVVPNPQLREKLQNGRQGLVGFVNILGQTAALAAYQHGQPWLDALLAYLKDNLDTLERTVREELPGVSIARPEGTYLAWLDCRETGLEDSCAFFLKEARVAVNDGREFGRGGEGFVRFNFGCPRAQLNEALERMKSALLSRK